MSILFHGKLACRRSSLATEEVHKQGYEQDSLQESLAENSHINAHDSKEADIEIPSELDSNFENSALLEFVQRQVG